MNDAPPQFGSHFRAELQDLFLWRRDVRRFRPDPVEPEVLRDLLKMACLAPSVGNSQPWRFVTVDETSRREEVIGSFEACNAEALKNYSGEQAAKYARLKLEGLREAPVHLAVFSDAASTEGHGLGARTMPETRDYSVVSAIQVLWLAARAQHIGMGWVSILDPDTVKTALDVPSSWKLVAYLCLGYAQEEHTDPELVRAGWQNRLQPEELILQR